MQDYRRKQPKIGKLLRCLGPIARAHWEDYCSRIISGDIKYSWYVRVKESELSLLFHPLSSIFFGRKLTKEVTNFVEYLIEAQSLPRTSAVRIVKVLDWQESFANHPEIKMQILILAEDYDGAIAMYRTHFGTEQFRKSMYALYFFSLARQGDFTSAIFDSAETKPVEKIEFHRYLWQKGRLTEARLMGRAISKLDLSDELRFKFLNNQARVCRDAGDMRTCTECIYEMERLLDPAAPGDLIAGKLPHKRALLNYNKAISLFVSGDHNGAIRLTEMSLQERSSEYEKKYLKLRMARSKILIGRREEALGLIMEVQAEGIDEWGYSLLSSVQAEYAQICEGDLGSAEDWWLEASAQLAAVSSSIDYANIGLSYLKLAQGRLNDAYQLAEREARTGLIEPKILSVLILLIQSDCPPERIHKLLKLDGPIVRGSSTLCGHWILAFMHADAYAVAHGKELFSVAELRAYAESLGVPYFSHVLSIANGAKKMPTAFISYCHSGTPESWVYDFAQFLRSNGVDAEYDNSLRGKGATINFDEMMIKNMQESDFVIAILSPDYALRIKDPKTGSAVEYNMMRADIIRMQLDRYVFCIHSGDFNTSLPSTMANVDCYDLRTVDFAHPNQALEDILRHVHGVERIDMKPIGPRPAITPRTP